MTGLNSSLKHAISVVKVRMMPAYWYVTSAITKSVIFSVMAFWKFLKMIGFAVTA